MSNKSIKKIKAVALISSGLDSLLAAKIVKDQGIDVRGVCYFYQFDSLSEKSQRGEIQALFYPLNIPVTVVDTTDAFMPIFLYPDHGYGSGVNPCIDCHLFMFRSAKEMMDNIGARFLVTGEVVGQRPMSQNKHTLFHIDRVSGLKGLILRPLSAKLMPTTLPEEMGWVDRNKLYDFSGRSRKPQIALAGELGIKEFNSPAGGCILTEPNYSRRVKAYFKYRGKDLVSVEVMKLLRYGRHFWPREYLHVVVGRDKNDNQALEAFQSGRWIFEPVNVKGPLVLATGIKDMEDCEIVAKITARYCSVKVDSSIAIHYIGKGNEGNLHVLPFEETLVEEWRV